MARIVRTLTALLAFTVFTIMGASAASACTTTTTVSVPTTAYVFAALDGSGDMVGTDEECYSYVTTTDDGTVVFRDYGTDADGNVAPITTCEGDPTLYTFTVGATTEDGETDYILSDEM